MNSRKIFLFMLLSALLGGLVAAGGVLYFGNTNEQVIVPSSNAQNVRFSSFFRPDEFTVPDGLNFVYAADVATPAVVHIRASYSGTGNVQPQYRHPFEEMFPDLFGGPSRPQYRQGIPRGASGSGVILSDDGYIVTNNHVIEGADEIEVILSDNRRYIAKLVGTDPSTDIALLKVDAKDLPNIAFGNSDEIKVGEWVLAVGNPYDLTSTVTAGIVSAKSRNIGILQDSLALESFIQTDAAVNPGNSGGALVNLKGELVGVNTAIASPTGSYSGYSFAVPSALVRKIVDDLREYGTVQRGLLGVNIGNLNSALAKQQNIDINSGVYIGRVGNNSAAAEAGLQEGDVITGINDRTIRNVAELQGAIAKNRPGDKVEVTYYRDGKFRKTNAILKNSMGTTRLLARNENTLDLGGAVLKEISAQERARFGLKGGVRIERLSAGKLKEAKVREGFIITAIDNQPVATVEDVTRILDNKKGQGTLIEGVYPNGEKAYYGLPW
jgi:serine protease Do